MTFNLTEFDAFFSLFKTVSNYMNVVYNLFQIEIIFKVYMNDIISWQNTRMYYMHEIKKYEEQIVR